MSSILSAFFISFLVTIFLIRSQKYHSQFSGDSQTDGPQKFHTHSVPRIGGLGIFLGLACAVCIHIQTPVLQDPRMILLLCAIPVFLIGLIEDLTKKIGVRTRLLFTAFGALLATIYLDTPITHLDIPGIDWLLQAAPLAIVFTVFSIAGLANAYNIIDGFNGLSSMVGIIALLAMAYVGLEINDSLITYLSITMSAAILGFFIWNYPRGLIFLGDGGAYLIGFWIAVLSILIVYRNPQVSPWFALLINAYPIWETIFSIYRRQFHQGKSPGHPDGIHFHSLVFRRILNRTKITNELDWFSANAKTSPYLWVMSSFAVIPAIFFWSSTPILIGFFILFAISYVWLYKRMVTFKTPSWMKL